MPHALQACKGHTQHALKPLIHSWWLWCGFGVRYIPVANVGGALWRYIRLLYKIKSVDLRVSIGEFSSLFFVARWKLGRQIWTNMCRYRGEHKCSYKYVYMRLWDRWNRSHGYTSGRWTHRTSALATILADSHGMTFTSTTHCHIKSETGWAPCVNVRSRRP